MLPFAADWRWGVATPTSLWYPKAHLFRQSEPGDWAGVLERVVGDIVNG